ncbi:hypothetical protein FACS189459_1170 [Bacilli bacterium]|nr:hypothetical protein FACS189459_1170 [Bacilli bacterium]
MLNFYRDTNQPIKDVLEIPEKFNNAKANFLQQKIIKELTKKFKVKFDLPPPKVTPNVMPKPETEPNKE